VYFAGVKSEEGTGNLVTSSGRVALVQVHGSDVADAQNNVYNILDKLELPHMFFRHDIASKALL
jgi:hypothetical protein